MRSTQLAFAVVSLFGMVLLLGACSSDPPGCVPGQSIACAGSNGCRGFQVCSVNGNSYGACVCSSDPGDFPSAGPNSGWLGAACETSASCRRGLECVSAHSNLIHGEGPSGGMCLARCLPDHDFCQGLDALARCVVLEGGDTPNDSADDLAYCMPGCSVGTQPNEADKCRGRVDLVCVSSMAGANSGYCRPACRSDVDCAPRFCNLATGLCSDHEPSGAPIGATCDASSAASSCAGGCVSTTDAYSQCTGVCSYDTPGCGQTDTSGALAFYCWQAVESGAGAGDLGYCAKLCDCDSDCARVDSVCEAQPSLVGKTGRRGVCGSKLLPSGTPRKNTPC